MNAAVFSSGGSRPPAPTRDQIIAVRYAFQGLTVDLPSYGVFPWGENLAWLTNPADREAAYAAKRANGDTHAILTISGAYNEPGTPYSDPSLWQDWTQRLSAFHDLAAEVIDEGFLLDIRLAGDGQSVNDNPGPGEYNDQVGWTYGQQWLMQNFARIFDALSDLNDYIIWTPGFDSIFYGWSPEQVVAFGAYARGLGAKYLGLEFNTGHIPLGEGGSDYLPGGRMQDYDVIFGEFDPWNYHADSTWQICGRLVDGYVRPPDQPAHDDPNPPYYLATPNPRGPWSFVAMEILLYLWARWQCSRQDCLDAQAYFAAMGCTNICI